jgi:hypothetical protein
MKKNFNFAEFLQEKFLKFILATCSQWRMISWITQPLQNFSLTRSRNSKTPVRHSHRRFTLYSPPKITLYYSADPGFHWNLSRVTTCPDHHTRHGYLTCHGSDTCLWEPEIWVRQKPGNERRYPMRKAVRPEHQIGAFLHF